MFDVIVRPDHQNFNGINTEILDKKIASSEEHSTDDSQKPPKRAVPPFCNKEKMIFMIEIALTRITSSSWSCILQNDRTIAGEDNILLIIIVENNRVAPNPWIGDSQRISSANSRVDSSLPYNFFLFILIIKIIIEMNFA